MKFFRILGIGVAATLPQFAFATSTISGPALGTVDAIYDFCVRVDPEHAANFRAQEASLVNGIATGTVSSVEGSSDYKLAYESFTALLAKIPTHDVAKTCAAGVTKQKEVEVEKEPGDKKPGVKKGPEAETRGKPAHENERH